jgi:bacterial leucyl aminopeptidase
VTATISRNIYHKGNKKAVTDYRKKLAQACKATAHLRSFTFLGKTYKNIECEIPGTTDEIIVIGAHLDSTAKNDAAYVKEKDAAPGADDDASGVAAAILIATKLKALVVLKGTPKRGIRFVLFNAEEYGMRGSFAYAENLKEHEGEGGPSVAGMIAMDMIGWHRPGAGPFEFEIHSTGIDYGREYPDAKPASDSIAAEIEKAATPYGALDAQRYPLNNCDTDPATGHSDHTSFHQQGYGAALVSEDMYVNVCVIDPAPNGNPDYHKSTDVEAKLFPVYAADIAQTVAAAAWTIANS